MPEFTTVKSADADIVSVGESWVQDRWERFVHTRLPKARSNRILNGYSGTATWKIPSFENFLQSGEGLMHWGPGQSLPPVKPLKASDVSGVYNSRIARPRTRNLDAPNPRFEDIENRYVPGMMSEIYQGREKELCDYLNATNYGTLLTFTGSVLDTDPGGSDTTPYIDIQNNLSDLRPYRLIPGMELHCFMSEDVAFILAAHVDYTGAGAGSAIGQGLALDEFQARFSSKHGLDQLHVFGTAANAAVSGADASIDEVGGGGILAFVLCDGRASDFDVTHGADPEFSPDGGLVFVCSDFDVSIRSQVYNDLGLERFVARTEFGYKNPRGTAFGQVYDPAEIKS